VLFPATEKAPLEIAENVTRDDLRGTGTVLVVDDEEMIRSFTRSALEPHGYTVLLDVAMPGMDGLETLERIRGIRPDVPVIVCSGFGDVDVETRFAGKDIAGFFPKPYTVKQLEPASAGSMPHPSLLDKYTNCLLL
jgi:CheY-like chemotaxis protein